MTREEIQARALQVLPPNMLEMGNGYQKDLAKEAREFYVLGAVDQNDWDNTDKELALQEQLIFICNWIDAIAEDESYTTNDLKVAVDHWHRMKNNEQK